MLAATVGRWTVIVGTLTLVCVVLWAAVTYGPWEDMG